MNEIGGLHLRISQEPLVPLRIRHQVGYQDLRTSKQWSGFKQPAQDVMDSPSDAASWGIQYSAIMGEQLWRLISGNTLQVRELKYLLVETSWLSSSRIWTWSMSSKHWRPNLLSIGSNKKLTSRCENYAIVPLFFLYFSLFIARPPVLSTTLNCIIMPHDYYDNTWNMLMVKITCIGYNSWTWSINFKALLASWQP